VTNVAGDDATSGEAAAAAENTALEAVEISEDDEPEVIEVLVTEEGRAWMEILIRLLALLHTLTSVSMLVAYYHLKVSDYELYTSKACSVQLWYSRAS